MVTATRDVILGFFVESQTTSALKSYECRGTFSLNVFSRYHGIQSEFGGLSTALLRLL
jgi:hypothetical protein